MTYIIREQLFNYKGCKLVKQKEPQLNLINCENMSQNHDNQANKHHKNDIGKDQNAQKWDSDVSENDCEESESQESSGDQIKQRAAFEIMEEEKLLEMRKNKQRKVQTKPQFQQNDLNSPNEDELDDDEREAFLYLHSVRKEKKTLLKQKKLIKDFQSRSVNKKNHEQNAKQSEKQVNNSISEPIKTNRNASYINCVLSNFNIVIQNIKYMIKSNQSYAHNNRKFNTKLYEWIKIDNEPKIYDLIKLTIGQVEEAIRKLSLEYTLGPKQKKVNTPEQKSEEKKETGEQKQSREVRQEKFKKYALWIHSMLAVHQGWSPYKHFESLAQINFILTKKSEQGSILTQSQREPLLLVLVLMVNFFEQRHLKIQMEQMMQKMN